MAIIKSRKYFYYGMFKYNKTRNLFFIAYKWVICSSPWYLQNFLEALMFLHVTEPPKSG